MLGNMVRTALEMGGRWVDNPNLILALELSAIGWYVMPFAIVDGAKMPAIKSAHPIGDPLHNICCGECGQDGHGYNDATLDAQKIERWWWQYPDAVPAVNCVKSGLIALDFDRPGPAHPKSVDGVKSFKAWAAGEKIEFTTPMQKTPGGGYHAVFKAPELPDDVKIPGHLVDGVDIKYNGTICTGELPDGRCYEWLPGREFFETVADFPNWIARRIVDAHRIETAKRKAALEASTPNDGKRPGDEYQRRHTWEEVLKECLPDWFIDGERVYRGNKKRGVKATLRDGVFYIFTEAGLPGNVKSRVSYNKFSLLTDAVYNGSFSAAAKDLITKGYKAE